MDLEQACNGLADRFYDGVLGNEPADPLLDDMTALLGFDVGSIVTISHAKVGDSAFCASASGIDVEECRRAESVYRVSAGSQLRDGSPMPLGRLQHRDTLIDMAALSRQPYFQDFVLPNRLDEAEKMLLYRGQDRSVFINFARPRPHADLQRRQQVLQLMAPHMVRSTLIHVKLERVDTLRKLCWESVNMCPYPLVVFDNLGQVFLANRQAEGLVSGDGLTLAPGGLKAGSPLENQRLQFCLRSMIAHSEGGGPLPRDNDLLVSRPSGKRPYRLVVMPLMPEHQAIGHRPAAAVLVFDPDASHVTSVGRCREIFGLTRAEAEVAIGVMQGQSPEQIAAMQGRSATTVRNLLKRVFQKTEVSRQSELTLVMLRSPALFPGLSGLAQAHWDPFRNH